LLRKVRITWDQMVAFGQNVKYYLTPYWGATIALGRMREDDHGYVAFEDYIIGRLGGCLLGVHLTRVEHMAEEREPPEINWPEDMGEDKREELRGLLTAYDEALAEFDNDHKAIFPSNAERNRLFFGFLKRWSKAWSKPGPCMYDDCTKTSVARSHTISLGASIRLIAENDHVLTPKFGENGLELVLISVREASTFPGFCEEHESQFAVFEAKKTMTEPEHFRLRAFRTICREIYTKRHPRQKGKAMLAQYQQLREEFVIGRVKQASTGATVLSMFRVCVSRMIR
jgi:hypothetical protein